jgi:ribosome maturation factor RimP
MKSEELKCCNGKKAKLVLDNNYVLRGIIDKVNEDSIFFSTAEKTAIIRLDAIKEIVF